MGTARLLKLLTVAAFFITSKLPAQSLTVLHTFGANSYTNTDGAGPATGLLLSSNTLYGAAGGGANGSGTNNFGTVFSIGIDGSNFTVLHLFAGVSNSGTFPPVSLNGDGFDPQGALVLSGNTLYGVAGAGGTNGSGTVFAVSSDGSVFSVLHTFETNVPDGPFPSVSTNSEGADPNSLILDGETLYGTAGSGGTNAFGTIFSVKTNGSDFTVLHTFKALDGKNPQSTLVIADGVIYGTTPIGGTNGSGTVFSIATNGAGFKVIHTFTNNASAVGPYLNGLLLSGSKLFGTTAVGGTNDTGSLFSLNTNGTGYSVLYNFGSNGSGTNPSGVNPEGALLLAGDRLYGTANAAGAQNDGTVFSVNTNGSDFSIIYTFTKLHSATNADGAHPRNGVVLGGTSLYGTAYFGGGNANGTVFGLAVAPTITGLSLAETNAVLEAKNGLVGHTYITLSSTNVEISLNQWTPVATNVLSGGGSFTVTATNGVDPNAAQQFYILQAQ